MSHVYFCLMLAMSPLSRYTPIADAIVLLFGPDTEVVIHDLREDRVFYIANNLSGRQVGEDSLLRLDAEKELTSDVIGPYEKAGEQGHPVRSITSVLRTGEGEPIGLLCINADHSRHLAALETLQELVSPRHIMKRPEALFRHDWQQQVKEEITLFMQRHGKSKNLTRTQRRELLSHLDGKGLFYAKRSVEQLTALLRVSRATLYKDLAAIRKKESLEVKL